MSTMHSAMVLLGLTALTSASPLASQSAHVPHISQPHGSVGDNTSTRVVMQLAATLLAQTTMPVSIPISPSGSGTRPNPLVRHDVVRPVEGGGIVGTLPDDLASLSAEEIQDAISETEDDYPSPYLAHNDKRNRESLRDVLAAGTSYCVAPCVRRQMNMVGCHALWHRDNKDGSRAFDCLCESWIDRSVWEGIAACVRGPARCSQPNDQDLDSLTHAVSTVCNLWGNPVVDESERDDVRRYADRVFSPPQKQIKFDHRTGTWQ